MTACQYTPVNLVGSFQFRRWGRPPQISEQRFDAWGDVTYAG